MLKCVSKCAYMAGRARRTLEAVGEDFCRRRRSRNRSVKGAVVLCVLGVGVTKDNTLHITSTTEALATAATLDAGLATHARFLLECVVAADGAAGVVGCSRARAVETGLVFDGSVAAIGSSVTAIECGAWSTFVSEVGRSGSCGR